MSKHFLFILNTISNFWEQQTSTVISFITTGFLAKSDMRSKQSIRACLIYRPYMVKCLGKHFLVKVTEGLLSWHPSWLLVGGRMGTQVSFSFEVECFVRPSIHPDLHTLLASFFGTKLRHKPFTNKQATQWFSEEYSLPRQCVLLFIWCWCLLKLCFGAKGAAFYYRLYL